jgi:rhamnopyranosyl-N-acetylglucosaminyl-diphospho-decaprenol beta-1,3/1,4-galactofuranosyltransferase
LRINSRQELQVAAVVVTFNRHTLLLKSISALLGQTRPLDALIIVDNASTDGTREHLERLGHLGNPQIIYLLQTENTGGAGGFKAGLQYCLERGFDWVWLADDDAIALPDTIEKLLAIDPQPANLYGSSAVFQNQNDEWTLCWPCTADIADRPRTIRNLGEVSSVYETDLAPFLGCFVSGQLLSTIGLPDAGFFISGDDLEFTERARAHGARVFLVRDSLVQHPRPDDYTVTYFGRQFLCLRLPPWRRYYYVRNKIIIARLYYGARLFTQTLPGLLLRMIATLKHEKQRRAQASAFLLGIWHGVRNLRGRRVSPGKWSSV